MIRRCFYDIKQRPAHAGNFPAALWKEIFFAPNALKNQPWNASREKSWRGMCPAIETLYLPPRKIMRRLLNCPLRKFAGNFAGDPPSFFPNIPDRCRG
jgi:hypothetical protein